MISGRVVSTLVAKDVMLYFRNRFFAVITVLGVVAFAGVYYLLPRTAEEQLTFAVHAPVVPPALAQMMTDEGVTLEAEPSEESLREAVEAGKYQAGIALPEGMQEAIAAGARPEVRLYVSADMAPEFGEVYGMLVRELSFVIGGRPLALEVTEEVLGPDLAAEPVAPRNRMLPLLAVFVLLMETLGLASLITSEVESGTLRALFVTPMRVPELFLAKGITGTMLAFVQAAVLMLVTGGLMRQPLLILAVLLLGAVMVTGLAFLLASVARDMMSVLGWGVLLLILLAVPGMAILLPGLVSRWVRVVPSHYVADAVHRVVNYGAGWADVAGSLAMTLGFAVLFLALGMAALRRRFA